MFNNPYIQRGFNQQNMYEQIDNQINQLQQMREQIKNNQQQPAINQTFQIAPTHQGTMKYANSIDDVAKEIVFGDTAFFSKDLSVLWIKNTKGEIKAYTLAEIIQKDEKDLQIEFLQAQIDALKKGMINHESNDENDGNDDAKQSTTDTTTNGKLFRTTTKKSKSTSV